MGITASITQQTVMIGRSIAYWASKPLDRYFAGSPQDRTWDGAFNDFRKTPQDHTGWLYRPLKRKAEFSILKGRYGIHVYDQPGKWMTDHELRGLYDELENIAVDSMDKPPRYGVFTRKRAAFENRIVAVASDRMTGQAVGFTAMVYFPYFRQNRVIPIIHLGLTMIRRGYRGHRLQTPLFQKIFLVAMFNQHRFSFIMTNIAASPAGIGATSDYFLNVYPNYKQTTTKTRFHEDVAEQVLAKHRGDFGCSRLATFDPETFVIRGSNQPEGGGAYEFIKEDPVSRYRVEACNAFCRQHLDFKAGDELFQVGKVDYFLSSWASRQAKRQLKSPAARPPGKRIAPDLQMDAR